MPQYLRIQNEDKHGAYFIELPRGLKECLHVKGLDEFLVPHKDGISLLIIIHDCLIKGLSYDTSVLWNPCWTKRCENQCNVTLNDLKNDTLTQFGLIFYPCTKEKINPGISE